ncbi:MAG: xanthine dehydrogenase family protein molybdopterin-binding subunit, partial [Mesorhizobium sp.]
DQLVELAISDPASPFHEVQANTLVVANGRIASPRGNGPEVSIAELLRSVGREHIEAKGDTMPANSTVEDRYKNYTTIAMALPHTEGDYSRH